MAPREILMKASSSVVLAIPQSLLAFVRQESTYDKGQRDQEAEDVVGKKT
jgi:hypothetical protein